MRRCWLGQHWSIVLDGEWDIRQTEDGDIVLQSEHAAIWAVVYLLEGEPPAQAIARFVNQSLLPPSHFPDDVHPNLVTHSRNVYSSDGYHLFTMNAIGDEMLSLEFWDYNADLDWAISAWRSLKWEIAPHPFSRRENGKEENGGGVA